MHLYSCWHDEDTKEPCKHWNEGGIWPGRLLLTFQTVDRYLDAFSIQTLAYIMKLVSQTFVANTTGMITGSNIGELSAPPGLLLQLSYRFLKKKHRWAQKEMFNKIFSSLFFIFLTPHTSTHWIPNLFCAVVKSIPSFSAQKRFGAFISSLIRFLYMRTYLQPIIQFLSQGPGLLATKDVAVAIFSSRM